MKARLKWFLIINSALLLILILLVVLSHNALIPVSKSVSRLIAPVFDNNQGGLGAVVNDFGEYLKFGSFDNRQEFLLKPNKLELENWLIRHIDALERFGTLLSGYSIARLGSPEVLDQMVGFLELKTGFGQLVLLENERMINQARNDTFTWLDLDELRQLDLDKFQEKEGPWIELLDDSFIAVIIRLAAMDCFLIAILDDFELEKSATKTSLKDEEFLFLLFANADQPLYLPALKRLEINSNLGLEPYVETEHGLKRNYLYPLNLNIPESGIRIGLLVPVLDQQILITLLLGIVSVLVLEIIAIYATQCIYIHLKRYFMLRKNYRQILNRVSNTDFTESLNLLQSAATQINRQTKSITARQAGQKKQSLDLIPSEEPRRVK